MTREIQTTVVGCRLKTHTRPRASEPRASEMAQAKAIIFAPAPAGSFTEDEGNPNYQGWLPNHKSAQNRERQKEDPSEGSEFPQPRRQLPPRRTKEIRTTRGGCSPEIRPKPRASMAAPSEDDNSATAPASIPLTEDEGNPNYQGWLPSGHSAPTPVAAAPL